MFIQYYYIVYLRNISNYFFFFNDKINQFSEPGTPHMNKCLPIKNKSPYVFVHMFFFENPESVMQIYYFSLRCENLYPNVE